jgi:lipopolysaccharide export system permease protein
MNATGIGNKFLIQAALSLAVITSCAAAFNSLYLSSWAQEKEAQLMEELVSNNSVDLLQTGQFQKTPDGTGVVFIDDIKDRTLKNVFIAQITSRDSIRPSVSFADSGEVNELSDGRQILTLFSGSRYESIPTQLDYMNTDFSEYDALIGQREVKPEEREIEAIPTLDLIGSSDLSSAAELQWRISLIICIPLLTIIVIPLSEVNPRQGRFAKMGPAILFYLAYFLLIIASKKGIEDGSISAGIGLWPINGSLLLLGVTLNSMNSVPIRRFKEKLKQGRLRHV